MILPMKENIKSQRYDKPVYRYTVTDFADHRIHHCLKLPTITKLKSSQSPQDCVTKSKHSKHNRDGSFASCSVATKRSQWIQLAPKESQPQLSSRIGRIG